MAIEEPGYAIVREGPDFELRRYQPQLLAETEVRGRFDQAGGKAFRILADYIFGNNQAAEKIARRVASALVIPGGSIPRRRDSRRATAFCARVRPAVAAAPDSPLVRRARLRPQMA